MSLCSIKYLFHLIFEGEKTSREIAEESGSSIFSVSHAMRVLQQLSLVKHPERRPRSWEVNHTKELILILEKLLLISKNNTEIKALLEQPSVVRIGISLNKKEKGLTIPYIIKTTRISKPTVLKVLNKMLALNLLRKKIGKPNLYSVVDTTLSQLFFDACREIAKIIVTKNEKEFSSQEIMRHLRNDDSVLILVHYGSTARGTSDSLSDIDILAVTRDKISRGNILNRYNNKKIDLHVYSKSGFLQLIKTQPDFIKNISTAKVLKGKDILEAIIQ